MKQSFHLIPPDSSNKIKTMNYREIEMRKVLLMTVMFVILAAIGANSAQAEDQLMLDDYYSPGSEVEITGIAQPFVQIMVNISDSVGLLSTLNTSADPAGDFTVVYRIAETAEPDVYRVVISFEDELIETNFRVTTLKPIELISRLRELVTGSKKGVEHALAVLEARGIEIPEDAEEYYNSGNTALEEAEGLEREGLMKAAAQRLMVALRHFRDALQELEGGDTQVLPRIKEREQERRRIRQEIDRTHQELERIRTLEENLEERGIDTTRLEEAVDRAESLLNGSRSSLMDDDLQRASERLREARLIMNRIQTVLKEHAARIKKYLLQRFRNQLEIRIRKLRELIYIFGNRIPDSKTEAALETLQRSQMALNMVEVMIERWELDSAMEELKRRSEEVRGSLVGVNGVSVTNTIRAMDLLQARIQALNSTTSLLTLKGRDASSELARLNEEKERYMIYLDSLRNESLETDEVLKDIVERLRKFRASWEADTNPNPQTSTETGHNDVSGTASTAP